MTRFDHSISGSDGQRYMKMVFPVPDDPSVGTESMWVEVIGDGTYRLKNIPGWTSGLAVDDVVAGHETDGILRFDRTLARGGHSTYRVAFQSQEPSLERSGAVERLRSLGCGLEKLSDRMLAVDVPAEVSIHDVYIWLEQAMADGVWWFDELHCGHPTDNQ